MNTLNLIEVGTIIPTVGKVEKLHFYNLFEPHFVIEDRPLSEEYLVSELLKNKENLLNRVFSLLINNQVSAFKYMQKLILKTQNLPLINRLNAILSEISSMIDNERFDFNNYSHREVVRNKLNAFWFSYFINKA